MLALIRNAEKRTLPRFDSVLGRDVPTLMVVVDVDFVDNEAGALVHTQRYAHLPEEVDANYYQNQADAMQADLDHARATSTDRAIAVEQDQIADRQIRALMSDKLVLSEGK